MGRFRWAILSWERKSWEATLEMIQRGLVVGIQDMGAAGLTCSTCEMAGRAKTGIEIDLDRVPQRVKGMTAYEIMLSESQERMLAVCKPEDLEAVLEICERWECGGVVIGQVTRSGRMVVRHHGEIMADLPVDHLTENAPIYYPEEIPPAKPLSLENATEIEPDEIPETLLSLLACPTIASKRWVYRRYDHMVQTNTIVRPGDADAAVLRIKGENGAPDRLIAVASDGNHRLVARNPTVGGRLVVCEAARNLACVGAEPGRVNQLLEFRFSRTS